EPLGKRLVLVTRVYSDAADEFVVIVLDRDGIAQRFSVDPADWAESAPLGRFRLVNGSLYQLGSSPAGAFFGRLQLEAQWLPVVARSWSRSPSPPLWRAQEPRVPTTPTS